MIVLVSSEVYKYFYITYVLMSIKVRECVSEET